MICQFFEQNFKMPLPWVLPPASGFSGVGCYTTALGSTSLQVCCGFVQLVCCGVMCSERLSVGLELWLINFFTLVEPPSPLWHPHGPKKSVFLSFIVKIKSWLNDENCWKNLTCSKLFRKWSECKGLRTSTWRGVQRLHYPWSECKRQLYASTSQLKIIEILSSGE